MVVNPPTGRKRLSPTSVQIKAVTLKTLIGWMALEGLTAFHDIDGAAVERLRAWLLARRGQSGRPLSPNTVANYMVVLKDLYRQRASLTIRYNGPAPARDNVRGGRTDTGDQGTIPFIPDAIAIALLSSALEWVEDHGPTIIEAETIRLTARALGLTQGGIRQASYHVRKALRRAALKGPTSEPLNGAYAVRRAATHLVELVTSSSRLVGMRVSEILSMQVARSSIAPSARPA